MLEAEEKMQPLFYNYIADKNFIPLIYYIKCVRGTTEYDSHNFNFSIRS